MILLIYLLIIILIFLFKLFSNYLEKENQKKIKNQKKENERLKKEEKNHELLQQLSQYKEFQNNFKNLFNVNVSIEEYRDWIYNSHVDIGETFVGYMLRTNNISLFGDDFDDFKKKCNTLNIEELFSITPKGKGVNINEMKKNYSKAYWEDRKKDIYWD